VLNIAAYGKLGIHREGFAWRLRFACFQQSPELCTLLVAESNHKGTWLMNQSLASISSPPSAELEEALEGSLRAVQSTAAALKHWGFFFAGGPDSTAALTVLVALLESGRLPRPESLTVAYVDTRVELPPVRAAALALLQELRGRGITPRILSPELNDRFFVRMIGHGAAPPDERCCWCTARLRLWPALASLAPLCQAPGHRPLLIFSGQRARGRVCAGAGASGGAAECGQAWLAQSIPTELGRLCLPLSNWSPLLVDQWLLRHAPALGLPTLPCAHACGLDRELLPAPPPNRPVLDVGCMVCPLSERDEALTATLEDPLWRYLEPLRRLRPLYRELGSPACRMTRSDLRNAKIPPSMSAPLTFEARRHGLERVLEIQAAINDNAAGLNRPFVTLINSEELERIEELIQQG
jgi:DNA sulfur modification protein DndC